MPRNTALFGPTFHGETIVRLGDVRQDPRYGHNPPHLGMPAGHPPVVSYLAAPVVSRTGEVLGGLFFGHPDPDVFGERHERIAAGLASFVAIALDNARLFETAHAAETRYRALFDGAADGLLVIDGAGGLIDANPAAEALFGRDHDELCRLTVRDVVAREPAWVETEFAQLVETGSWQGETDVRRRDGTAVPVEALVTQVDLPGRPVYVAALRDVSERRRTDAALREAEARYRSLVEQVPAVVYIRTPEDTAQYVSPQIEAMFGYTVAEWMEDGSLWRKLVHPDDRERIVALADQRAGTADSVAVEYRLIARDGRIVWIRDEAVGVRDESGQLLYRQGICLDITAAREAEAALATSEERLRVAMNAAQIGIWDWNLQTGELVWSERVKELHGLTDDAFDSTYAVFATTVHPDDLPVVEERVARSLAAGTDYEVEYRVRTAAGPPRWLAATGRVLRDDTGRALRMIGTALDISERKTAEAALREGAETFDGLFDAAAEAIVIHDGTTVAAANRAFADLIGDDAAAIVGRPLADFVAPSHRSETFSQIAAGSEQPYESFVLRRDGATVPVEVLGRSVRFRGRPMRFATLRNIASRKAAEAALAHQAFHDGLTGLPNRAQLETRLAALLAASDGARHARPGRIVPRPRPLQDRQRRPRSRRRRRPARRRRPTVTRRAAPGRPVRPLRRRRVRRAPAGGER